MRSIELNEVSLEYPVLGVGGQYLKKKILSAATGGLITGSKGTTSVKALREITFSLVEGDRLGLVGHNGAGKSTLLKLLAGIYMPTSGYLRVNGSVVSTLNLSLGFEPEATGLENIIIRGLLLGLSRKQINEKIEEIAEFTELGDYLKLPARIYSSGMMTRLAFATVTAIASDILLMDEVIGAGDAAFLEKAEKRLTSFMEKSKILVIASHSDETIKRFCNKAILLKHGNLIDFGPVDEVLASYHNCLQNSSHE